MSDEVRIGEKASPVRALRHFRIFAHTQKEIAPLTFGRRVVLESHLRLTFWWRFYKMTKVIVEGNQISTMRPRGNAYRTAIQQFASELRPKASETVTIFF